MSGPINGPKFPVFRRTLSDSYSGPTGVQDVALSPNFVAAVYDSGDGRCVVELSTGTVLDLVASAEDVWQALTGNTVNSWMPEGWGS